MPNILKAPSNNHWVYIFALYLNSSSIFAGGTCDTVQLLKKPDVRDVICENDGTSFTLHYAPARRLIWLESNNENYRLTLHKFEKNAGPELIGEDDEIKFVARNLINHDGRLFLGVKFSERSMRGNGMGQCGAGAEVYFMAMELSEAWLSIINKFKVGSCIDAIDASPDSTEHGASISITPSNKVMFRWLNYPGFENPVTGIYDFLANKLKVKENTPPHVWTEY